MKGDDAPCEKQNAHRDHKKSVLERKIDQPANHCASSVASRFRTSRTTCWPGAMPERICSLFPGSVSPVFTSIRRNLFPSAGTKTQSRSCKCRMAEEGMAAYVSFTLLVNVALRAVAPVGAEAVLEPDRGPGGGKESEPATHRIIHSTHVSGLHPRQKRKHPYRTYIDRPSREDQPYLRPG